MTGPKKLSLGSLHISGLIVIGQHKIAAAPKCFVQAALDEYILLRLSACVIPSSQSHHSAPPLLYSTSISTLLYILYTLVLPFGPWLDL